MVNVKNEKIFAILYIISMSFAFNTRYGDFNIGYKFQLIIGLVWIFIAFLDLYKNKFRYKKNGLDFFFFLKIYLIPPIIIHLYTIFLMLIGQVKWSFLSTNATIYIPVVLAISSIYLFEKKALKYNVFALILSWTISMLISLFLKGFMIFPHAILQAYINPYDNLGGLTVNYLELHDIVLACGYLVIFYMLIYRKIDNKKWLYLVLILLIMILGMKRISILGIIVSSIYLLIMKLIDNKYKQKVSYCFGIFGFIMCYLMIYILSCQPFVIEYINNNVINVMGRNYYYEEVLKLSKFSPLYLGIGRNVVTKLLNTKLAFLRVGGVHSDIIKMYVENGFIMFGIWLWYYLIKLPKIYFKKFGIQCGVLYFSLIIYTFVLYLTDNIEIYFVCQIFAIIIPLSYLLKYDKESKKKTYKKVRKVK